VPLAGVLVSVLLVARAEGAANVATPPVPVGGLVAVGAADGNERITGECTLKRPDLLSCVFLDARLLTSDLDEIARKQREAAETLAHASADEVRELRRGLAGSARAMKLDKMIKVERLGSEPKLAMTGERVGPKMRQLLSDQMRASRSADLGALARASVDLERRTCRLSAFTFKVDFKPLGPDKWIGTVGPAGLCGIKKVYELAPQQPGDDMLWQLSETLVAIGKTTGACAWHDSELNKREVWGPGPGPLGGFELPCDFLK